MYSAAKSPFGIATFFPDNSIGFNMLFLSFGEITTVFKRYIGMENSNSFALFSLGNISHTSILCSLKASTRL